MDRSVFRKKAAQEQTPRVDRFILPRDSLDDRKRRTWRLQGSKDTVDIWQAKYQKQKKYRHYLDEVFGLEPRGADEAAQDGFVQPWPCAPRRKGYLSSADSILDLPSYSYATFPELLDWSNDDVLVAALGTNYHLFSWKDQNVMGQGMTQFGIHCCKFDPKGDLLLIGSIMRTIELHSISKGKMVDEAFCKCASASMISPCAITAVDWSPTGNSFVTGCSRGLVIAFDSRTVQATSWRRIRLLPILTVKISPDTRYVATVALNSPLVQVLTWPSLEYHSTLNSNCIVQTMSWHPWRSALLGVGVKASTYDTLITMWDTPSSRLSKAKLKLNKLYSLDVMLFSHRTGELVLSLWNPERVAGFPKTCSQLLVMSDPYTVVDQSGEGKNVLDRVRTMVFSPDGTKLATATAEEDLIIWNFLPEDKNNKNNRKSNRFAAIPTFLDHLTHGYVLR